MTGIKDRSFTRSLSPFTRLSLIPSRAGLLIMECQYTSCYVTCHRCNHAWTYMGIRLASLNRSRRPVKVGCPKCHAKVVLQVKEAR